METREWLFSRKPVSSSQAGSMKGSSLLIALAVSNVTIIKDRISRWLVSGNDALSAICKEVLI